MKSSVTLAALLIVGCGGTSGTNQPTMVCQEAQLVIEGTVHGQWFQNISRIDPHNGKGRLGSEVNYPNGEYEPWGYAIDSTFVKSKDGTDIHEVQWSLKTDTRESEGQSQIEFSGGKSAVVKLNEDFSLYLLPPHQKEEQAPARPDS